jgi:plasmid stabilization system protein ParE
MQKKSKISWSLESLNSFENYVDWYLGQTNSPQLATHFINHITDCLELIEENPYLARRVDELPEVREYVVQKYPFLISYFIQSETDIIITSFLHQKMKY